MSASQTLSVRAEAAAIDAGSGQVALSGLTLAGSTARVDFLGTLGQGLESPREFDASGTSAVPPGTRAIRVEFRSPAVGDFGSAVDSLALHLTTARRP